TYAVPPITTQSTSYLLLLLYTPHTHPHLHSFPTRRSSDLLYPGNGDPAWLSWLPAVLASSAATPALSCCDADMTWCWPTTIRTRSEEQRLNSSHEWISYAVFCLKKKIKANQHS